ncbi:MAG TPA: exodeoxyribonuclease VII small subunit [Methylocella sp.]|nr:exodeoxyribonuclease VII small subunit [Methylocella sp.]
MSNPQKDVDPSARAEPDADIAAMPFEVALRELEQIVEKLEKGTVDLEEAIAIFGRGERLKRHCNELLKSAEERIEKITLGADGRPSGTEPLDVK